MTSRVIQDGEVYLNGKRYKLLAGEAGAPRVRTTVASQYPQKIVLGDTDKDSNPRTSLIVWDDWTDGIGLYSTDGKEGLKRFAFSRCETQHRGHLVLPLAFVNMASDPAGAGTTLEMTEFSGKLHGALNTGSDVYSWDPSDDTWSGKLHDLPAAATDALNFTLAGTEYAAFAHTGGYSYSSNGTSYTDDTTDTLHLAFWDDRLWGIDNTGQLWFALAIGTETNDAKLPLPAGFVNGLFTGPDASGEDILYASTEVGLYAHDAANSRFVKTKVAFPQDTNGGKGAATWNGDIYVSPGGMAVWRYDPVRGVIVSIGLDLDAGLPSAHRGNIQRLLPAHTGILAVVENTSAQGSIYTYNGKGWHFVAYYATTIDSAHVSDINGAYRVYWVGERAHRYLALPTGQVNPDEETRTYDITLGAWEHFTPWFNAGQNEIDKTAIRGRIDCTGMSANETVQVRYALNYSGSLEASALSVNENGVTTFTFPDVSNNDPAAGIDFRAIRFRLILNNGSTATLTPNVKSLSLEWRRKIPAKYGFSFDVDRTEDYGGRTPQEMKADLITAVESSTLVEFTFVTDTGNTQNYYVDVTQMEDIQDTGQNGEKGATRITVIET